MTPPTLERIIQLVDTLNQDDRQLLVAYLTQSRTQAQQAEDQLYSDEEIQEMISSKPKSGREIVELGRQSGAIGSWKDLNITDPLAWLQEQRKSRYQW